MDFYYRLKEQKVPVSIQEFLTLLTAVDKGLIHDLDTLYYVGRSVLVKDVGYFDKYDQVFAACFKNAEFPYNITDELLDWLKTPLNLPEIPREILEMLARMTPEELERLFEQRLREQTEKHDGGNKWIGTGGGSPFGHSARNPQPGIRVGGESVYHMAVKVALKRQYQNYRNDIVLDVRSIGLALKKLRILARVGQQDELDLDGTVDKTCKNAGDIEMVFRKKRKNNVKVLLLMDAGGSMEPFAQMVSRLFSAAHQASHFKKFKYYFFHNCIYQNLFHNIYQETKVATTWLLQNLDRSYRVIIVGDAAMAPWELSEK
ncbi:MAG TPA: VWA domain-containing protein, partial [Candidatus Lokiarchaeia archaeon]|nr:VWA domain-containing protein [Candidatus Lokiarchaeia archaeon]